MGYEDREREASDAARELRFMLEDLKDECEELRDRLRWQLGVLDRCLEVVWNMENPRTGGQERREVG